MIMAQPGTAGNPIAAIHWSRCGIRTLNSSMATTEKRSRIRERDSMAQRRVPIAELLPALLRDLN